MQVRILHARTEKELYVLTVGENDTIAKVKDLIHQKNGKLYPSRQGLRPSPKTVLLSDETVLSSIEYEEFGGDKDTLYLKDLGPQIGWKTVFLVEYFGPFIIFPFFYARPWFVYGDNASKPMAPVVKIATVCWCFHYGKRLLETLFVHRFSKGTMPLFNIFKNSGYYWGFAAYVAFFVCHPLYTPPGYGNTQVDTLTAPSTAGHRES